MSTKRLLTVPAVALALAVVVAPVSPAAAAPGPRAVAANAVVVIPGAANGGTVQAHTGDLVQVDLAGFRDYTVTWLWSVPAAGSPSVLSAISGSASPNGDAQATFVAAAVGTSTVTATGRCVADRGAVCPPWIIPWRATVVVS
ncbi:hypothetical protein [Kitasatospora sp. NPDC091207]|uniref:hypothetical protein n=1 Tax=Kitasatospora sp. NPDC091207 TaxID=3364083 RepID=UPI0038224483